MLKKKESLYNLLFVVYFRKTKLSICPEPQEGSVAQCLESALHEVGADDECWLMSNGSSSGVAV